MNRNVFIVEVASSGSAMLVNQKVIFAMGVNLKV
jgi:hypothetical protein